MKGSIYMVMVRMAYASTATAKFNPAQIGSILEASARNNPMLDVTGLLFIDKQYFFQCLEGPRASVNLIYNKLVNDERHRNVEIIEFREVADRYFAGWTMKYVPSEVVTGKVLRQTGLTVFDPYRLDSRAYEKLLQAFRFYRPADEENRRAPQRDKTDASRRPAGTTAKGWLGWFGIARKPSV